LDVGLASSHSLKPIKMFTFYPPASPLLFAYPGGTHVITFSVVFTIITKNYGSPNVNVMEKWKKKLG
jgi:hypothetical protein